MEDLTSSIESSKLTSRFTAKGISLWDKDELKSVEILTIYFDSLLKLRKLKFSLLSIGFWMEVSDCFLEKLGFLDFWDFIDWTEGLGIDVQGSGSSISSSSISV